MTHLYLGQNSLTGPFCSEQANGALAALLKLQKLSLYGNYLTGSLPPSLATLPYLDYLDVDEIVGFRPPRGMSQAIAGADDEHHTDHYDTASLECKTASDLRAVWSLMSLADVHKKAVRAAVEREEALGLCLLLAAAVGVALYRN